MVLAVATRAVRRLRQDFTAFLDTCICCSKIIRKVAKYEFSVLLSFLNSTCSHKSLYYGHNAQNVWHNLDFVFVAL